METRARTRSFSQKLTRRGERIGGPALVSAFMREERKLDMKIRALDLDKKHSISHIESEIDSFRKFSKRDKPQDNSSDDCMSVISEDGSHCSELEEVSCSEETTQLNSNNRESCKNDTKKKGVDKNAIEGNTKSTTTSSHRSEAIICNNVLGTPKIASKDAHGQIQDLPNRSTTTPSQKGETLLGSPRLLSKHIHGQFQNIANRPTTATSHRGEICARNNVLGSPRIESKHGRGQCQGDLNRSTTAFSHRDETFSSSNHLGSPRITSKRGHGQSLDSASSLIETLSQQREKLVSSTSLGSPRMPCKQMHRQCPGIHGLLATTQNDELITGPTRSPGSLRKTLKHVHRQPQDGSTTMLGSNLNHNCICHHQTLRSTKSDGQQTLDVNMYEEKKNHPTHHYIPLETSKELSEKQPFCLPDYHAHNLSSPSLHSLLKPPRGDRRDTQICHEAIDLAKQLSKSPIMHRKSFPRTHIHPDHKTKNIRHYNCPTADFGTGVLLPLRNRIGRHVCLNPMLFHPRFNSDGDDDDHDSFQVLRNCRYLRIPPKHMQPEVEGVVD